MIVSSQTTVARFSSTTITKSNQRSRAGFKTGIQTSFSAICWAVFSSSKTNFIRDGTFRINGRSDLPISKALGKAATAGDLKGTPGDAGFDFSEVDFSVELD